MRFQHRLSREYPMIVVQLNRQEEFNRLWKWAKTHMQHNMEDRKEYFAW